MLYNEIVDFCGKSNRSAPKKKWNAGEDELLIRAVIEHGTSSWCNIAPEVEGKDPKQCQARWKILKKRDDVQYRLQEGKARLRSETEDSVIYQRDYYGYERQPSKKQQKIKKSVKQIPRRYDPKFDYDEASDGSSLQYEQFVKTMNLDSKKQQSYQTQFFNHSSYQSWTNEDDELLLAAHKIYKGDIHKIKMRFKERSAESLKNRIESLLLTKQKQQQQAQKQLQQQKKYTYQINSSDEERKQGSEQFDISSTSFSNDSSKEETKEAQIIISYSCDSCYKNIQRVLKAFSHQSEDTLPAIKEQIIKLIISD